MGCFGLLHAQTPALAPTAPAPASPGLAPSATAPSLAPSAAPVEQVPAAPVSWTSKLIDLGKVKKGEKKSFQCTFTNTFGSDLKIYHVDACECTKIEFPRGIIPNGAAKTLDAVFDSTSKNASETISFHVFFENPNKPDDPPMMETVQYKFELVNN